MLLRSAMSLGSSKASSTAEVTWHPMPPLKSLSDASSLRGSPPCMGAGSQACGSKGWVSNLSQPRCNGWLNFFCFVARWASSSWVGRDLSVSTTSFPFCSLLLFGSTGSGCSSLSLLFSGRAGPSCLNHILPFLFPSPFWINSIRSDGLRWVASRRRRFRKRKGNLRLGGFPQYTFSRLIFYQLHQTPLGLPLDTHFVKSVLRMYSLIKNLEFVRGICQIYNFLWISFFFFFFFFFSSFLLFLEKELGWGCFYWRSGNEKWLGMGSVSREWNTLWNDEPLVGNTYTAKLRVVSSDYVLRSLEGERERCVLGSKV